MKLSALRSAQAAKQLESWVVPETHPANPSLCETFGEHTEDLAANVEKLSLVVGGRR